MSKYNIGPLTNEEKEYLTSKYKEGGSIISIAIKMVRPEKFLYAQLESLGVAYPKGSGIIICADCQIHIKVKNRKRRRCHACAYKRLLKKIQEHKDRTSTDPVVMNKRIARGMANHALRQGKLIRPERCELCNEIPKPMKNGQSGLRMDHYKGYDRENWTTVRFVCIPCDSKQIIERNKTITLSLEIVN